MGADNSRLFSPSEEDDFYGGHGYKRMSSERREATSTTIDIGFAIRARSCKALDGSCSGEQHGVLQRMVRAWGFANSEMSPRARARMSSVTVPVRVAV